jgi:hypothetical protein
MESGFFASFLAGFVHAGFFAGAFGCKTFNYNSFLNLQTASFLAMRALHSGFFGSQLFSGGFLGAHLLVSGQLFSDGFLGHTFLSAAFLQ